MSTTNTQSMSALDNILAELGKTSDLMESFPKPPLPGHELTLPAPIKIDITEENLAQYVIDKASFVITHGTQTLQTMTRLQTAEEVEAYSKLVQAVTSAIDTLNRLTIAGKKGSSPTTQKALTDNKPTVIIMSREELLDTVYRKAQTAINVNVTDS